MVERVLQNCDNAKLFQLSTHASRCFTNLNNDDFEDSDSEDREQEVKTTSGSGDKKKSGRRRYMHWVKSVATQPKAEKESITKNAILDEHMLKTPAEATATKILEVCAR